MRALLALLWAGILLGCCYLLLSNPPALDGDPLSLLEERERGSSGMRELRQRIAAQARDIYVLLDGADVRQRDEVRDALQRALESAGLTDPAALPAAASAQYDRLRRMLLPLRGALLTEEQRTLLAATDAAQRLQASIIAKLTSPWGSFYSQWLEDDPTLLLPEYLLESGIAEMLQESAPQGVVPIRLSADPLALGTQELLASRMQQAITASQRSHPQVSVQWIGYARFALDSAQRLRAELSLASVLSSICVLLTLLCTFQSLRPIALSGLSSCAGIAVASALTPALFSKIHVLTLTVGAVLSGVTVDYSLLFFAHYYSGRAGGREVMRRIGVSLWVGAISSCLAFAALAFSGLEGLSQIAVFSVLSLLASFLSVWLLFPYLVPKQGPGRFTLGMRLSSRLQRSLQALYASRPRRRVAFFVLVLLCFGMLRLRSNNDIRSFQAVSPELQQTQEALAKRMHASYGNTLLQLPALTSADYDRLLQAFNTLVLEGALSTRPFWALLPALAQRETNRLAYQAFITEQQSALRAGLLALGMSQDAIQRALAFRPPQDVVPLLLQQLQTAASESSQSAEIVVPLPGVLHAVRVAQVLREALPGAHVLEHAAIVSDLFARQMQRSIWLILAAYVVIIACFALRYGLRAAGLTLLQILALSGATLGTFGLCGVAVDFFSILALVIVLGLCIDYGVFFLEDQHYFEASATSVVTSSVATIAAFSALLFSSAQVMRHFGLTIALGVFFSMLLAPLVTIARPAAWGEKGIV